MEDLHRIRQLTIENRSTTKGGVGMIDEYFVATSTSENLIIYPNNREFPIRPGVSVVYIFNDKIFQDELPVDFVLSESIAICFSKDRITYFNFKNFTGGYYIRQLNE